MNKKELVAKYRPLVALACRVHNLRNLFRTRRVGSGNEIAAPCALLGKVRIQIRGSGNRILVEDFSTLRDCAIYINGSNNTLSIGSWSHLEKTEVCMEGDGNAITLGAHTHIYGRTHLAAMEGTRIDIGEDCLFSSDIHFRTGDSHSVLDLSGRRINPSRDIRLGSHVWVGTKVTCLKGALVGDHSIIGACALVTGQFPEPHCALAGVPAKAVRQGVDWSIRRIPVGETAPDFSPVTGENREETP